MEIVIQNIKMPLEHTIEDVFCAAQEIVRPSCIPLTNLRVYKQSLDARKKHNIHYVYSVAAEVPEGSVSLRQNVRVLEQKDGLKIPQDAVLSRRPVVVGMGPCGLFAALVLAASGNPPLLIERGQDVDSRTEAVEHFWQDGVLNPESNVQFGEGGAGTFSDGKLTTRIGDPRQHYVLQTFVDNGGPEDILYKAKPHIGTDCLRTVIRSMRRQLLEMGTEIRFNTCLTDIRTDHGVLTEIQLNYCEAMPCSQLILAIGHSSRDTYRMLHSRQLTLQIKPFAAGVRIEHTQAWIDELQYGRGHLQLPAADYRVAYNGKDHSCYSFCMCPGGVVVNASSQPGRLAVNGMSIHARDGINANSALVVNVRPEDLEKRDPLAAMEFQEQYESLAFAAGGGDYTAPIQLAQDFLRQRPSVQLKEVKPSYTGKVKLTNLKCCLPDFIAQGLREGLEDFERRMPGFASHGALLTGIETRTSAPVRILRDDTLQSLSVRGLYPAGEGAGYAGGIVSAAVDGIRAALAALSNQ